MHKTKVAIVLLQPPRTAPHHTPRPPTHPAIHLLISHFPPVFPFETPLPPIACRTAARRRPRACARRALSILRQLFFTPPSSPRPVLTASTASSAPSPRIANFANGYNQRSACFATPDHPGRILLLAVSRDMAFPCQPVWRAICGWNRIDDDATRV